MRLTWKLGGFELKALALASAIVAVATSGLAFLLDSSVPSVSCAADASGPGCETDVFFELVSRAGQVMAAMAALPVAVGAVLGSPLFAREIERGTVQLPWSLTSSRTRWFSERLLVSGAVVALIVLVPAVTSVVLEGAVNRGVDPSNSLVDFGLRGPSVVARALAIFAVSALLGVVLGRTLPALLLSVVGGVVVAILINPLALATQPTEFIAPLGDPRVRYGVVQDERYQDASGRLFTIDEATAQVPPDAADPNVWIDTNLRQVAIGVRGERYWYAERAATLMLIGLAAGSAIVGAVVVRRRRPI